MSGIGTKCVQAGYTPGSGEPRQVPIIQSTTFKYASSSDMGKLFDLEASGYFYSRLQNPTNDTVAAKIAALEGGSGKFFNIQHRQRRIGDGLAENGLRIGTEGCVQLLRCAVRLNMVCRPQRTPVLRQRNQLLWRHAAARLPCRLLHQHQGAPIHIKPLVCAQHRNHTTPVRR